MEEKGEIYKVELINEHANKGEPISFYKQGEFTELCAGPHLMSTGSVKAFKLTSCTGAYWRGNEKNKMLQRIYATAFPKQSALDEHLAMLEEAKKRDHNKLLPLGTITHHYNFIKSSSIWLKNNIHYRPTLYRHFRSLESEQRKNDDLILRR